MAGRVLPEKVGGYWIEATAKPSEGHWDYMRKPADHLAHELDAMASMVRLSRGEGTHEDYARLDVEPEPTCELLHGGEDCTCTEDLDPFDVFDGWALEIRRAVWRDNGPDDCQRTARTVAVLGTGGPHVELDISHAPNGRAEAVTLRRYWSQSDSARTTDTTALDIVSEFCETFLGVE